MLGLKLVTDPRWGHLARENLAEALTDHAWCEQKAATNAITLLTYNSEKPDLVKDMVDLAREELDHFRQVVDLMEKRGLLLGRERKDDYVGELAGLMVKGGTRSAQLVERLLFAAMIEARSCERFRVLTETVQDPELVAFYRRFMASEAQHYTLFLKYAHRYGEGVDVDARWQAWLTAEAGVIARYGSRERIHG